MKKKVTLSTAITLVILTAALTISITMLVAMRYFNRQVQSVAQRQAMYTHINNVDKKVREYYTDLDEELLRQKITEGYVAGVGDKYARYFSPTAYAAERVRLSGQSDDVGLRVCLDAESQMTISRVDTDSAADKAGVKVGDVLLTVDGTEVAEKTVGAVQYLLSGSEKMMLTVRRGDSTVAFELSPFRHTLRSVQGEMLDTVGYVKITDFYENTPGQFKSTVAALIERGATGLVFDLRNNSGGLSSSVQEMLTYIMPVGMYGSITDTAGKMTMLSSANNNSLGLPTVTLVNSATSGEAEFFAGVLDEFSLTTVVGETTAGKAKRQELFALEADNSAILLTVGEYGLLKSGSWEGKGLTPSLEAIMTEEEKALFPLMDKKNDPQLTAGLAQFSTINPTSKTTTAPSDTTAAPTDTIDTTAVPTNEDGTAVTDATDTAGTTAAAQ